MDQRHLIMQVLSEVLPQLDERHSKARSGAIKVPNLLVFGDTFAILSPVASYRKTDFLRHFQEFSAAVAYVIALAFIADLQLRGALSFGEFYTDSNIVIGPAIADAATWYEEPQFIGAIATPMMSRILLPTMKGYSPDITLVEDTNPIDAELTKMLGSVIRLFWPEFNLQTKTSVDSKQFCLNWPYAMFMLGPEITQSTGEHVSQFFKRKLKSRARPISAQQKYDNTEKYFDHCVSYIQAMEHSSYQLALCRAVNTDTPLHWLPVFLEKYR